MTTPDDHAEGATTLVGTLEELANGFPVEMTTRDGGQIECGECGAASDASAFEVKESRRLEGASDPSDMALVAGLSCPVCDARGSVVVRYGPEMDERDVDLLDRLELDPHDWNPSAP